LKIKKKTRISNIYKTIGVADAPIRAPEAARDSVSVARVRGRVVVNWLTKQVIQNNLCIDGEAKAIG
jgi:hypothetical protein